MTAVFRDLPALRYALGGLCTLAVCAILVATLTPFRASKNEVTWVPNEDAVHIGRNGTLLSSDRFRFSAGVTPSFSLEIWLEPDLIWTRGTVLSFYDPSNPEGLSLDQDYTTLVIRRGTRSQKNHGKPPQIVVEDLFRKRQLFLTVTSDGQETTIYVDGHLVTRDMGFGLSARDLSGQLIVANSPLHDNSWPGRLRGLAIYPVIFGAEEVTQRYQHWTERRRSPDVISRTAVAFYTFREHQGRTIHDEGTSGINLQIPERFLVVDHLFLEPPWSEIYADRSYFKNALLNIAGFAPLGFLLAAYFAVATEAKRPTLVAIIVGGGLSLLIEVLQAYIPTRFSGMTDIITNTFGTASGAVLYRAAAQMSASLHTSTNDKK